MFKRKRSREPLLDSVNETVRKLHEWRDACDGLFTVESEIDVGENFVCLEVKGIDEVDIRSFVKLIAGIGHVADYTINFEAQCMTLVFESASRRVRPAPEPSAEDETVANREFEYMVRLNTTNECDDDLRTASKCMAVVFGSVPASELHMKLVTVQMTTLPGLIIITARGLRKIDKLMLARLRKMQTDHDVDIVAFVSPKNNQCLQISVKKRKETVNL